MVGFMCVSMIRRARKSGSRGLSTSQVRWPGSWPEYAKHSITKRSAPSATETSASTHSVSPE